MQAVLKTINTVVTTGATLQVSAYCSYLILRNVPMSVEHDCDIAKFMPAWCQHKGFVGFSRSVCDPYLATYCLLSFAS